MGDIGQKVESSLGEKLSVDDAIIAAARESIMNLGLRKTSIAEIARQAGVSRPTVYRRYSDIGELTAEVINREILHTLEGLVSMPGNARERITRRLRIVVDRVAKNGFFIGLVETDPERVLDSLINPQGETQQAIVNFFILPGITHGQEDGSIRQYDTNLLANNVYRIMHSMVFTWLYPSDSPEKITQAIDEVVDIVDRYLRPNTEEAAAG